MNQHQYNQQNERDMWAGAARSGTPAGLARFSRSMPTRYNGKCEFCQQPTHSGVDFAAVTPTGWIAACAKCAASIGNQVIGLVNSIDRAAAGHDVASIIAGSDVALPDEVRIVAAIQGTASEAEAYDVLTVLLRVRSVIANGTRPVDPLVEALRRIANDSQALPRDRTFAESLVSQADRGRTLSDKQRAAGQNMVNRGNGSAPSVTPVENGLYIDNDGNIAKLYTTQNDRQGCKALVVLDNGKGTFEYVKGGTRQVAGLVANGKARKLTQDEAQAFGKLHGFCVNCARDLDDDRSLAVGYGPVCADNNGWFYPSVAQAADMLNRPTEV